MVARKCTSRIKYEIRGTKYEVGKGISAKINNRNEYEDGGISF